MTATDWAYDPDTLLDQRIVLLQEVIDDENSTRVIAQMLYLAHLDPQAPMTLWVDSPGGSAIGALAILDAMDQIAPPVHTHCLTEASGGAVHIMAHGAKGHRTSNPKAQFSLAPLLAESPGENEREEFVRLWNEWIGHLARDTGRPEAEIRNWMESWLHLDPIRALNYGIIDRIVLEAQPGPRPTG